ncbi:hypothetical protein F383_27589 [Gossypium arboreum]|uniref:Uncharacterized protein n=1 Tax=Gossypium arboreum TaxID=29729 RepID=A0A0B0P3Y7_GOSAR|nr:hypothetical protein F383_27589 [Gossypium arboreum]
MIGGNGPNTMLKFCPTGGAVIDGQAKGLWCVEGPVTMY